MEATKQREPRGKQGFSQSLARRTRPPQLTSNANGDVGVQRSCLNRTGDLSEIGGFVKLSIEPPRTYERHPPFELL